MGKCRGEILRWGVSGTFLHNELVTQRSWMPGVVVLCSVCVEGGGEVFVCVWLGGWVYVCMCMCVLRVYVSERRESVTSL